MKQIFNIFVLIVTLSVISCKKDSTKVTAETKALLQNKWTLISSNIVFPTNPTYSGSYIGIPTDYYLFGADESLIIRQAGQINFPTTAPISIDSKYTFLDNNRLTYATNPSVEINIKSLSNNLLVLSNKATNTVTNGSSVTTYEGVKTDSLKR
jgi:hypothetical protein